ncbi:cytochrome P450 78A3 [Pseudomassariella vexata]|uniref:Cytochrome P450 78A3 n=1 Tax=Pseudomassariella vexata TaxID=1141098 RepID=A0A1Y2D8Q2_9PEZI|nr:cytochrome P450 78A3 [Pseudomassariella vexata]ORY55506.1 cytochrome P450 78A3 [Pseudomassariella vexata]
MSRVTSGHVIATATAGSYLLARQFELSAVLTIATALSIVYPLYLIVWLGLIFPRYLSELRCIPTVPGCPIWGQFFTIISQEIGVPQRKWHQDHGPIVRYFFPFGNERLSVADDEALKHLTVKNPYNYPKPTRAKLWMVRVLGEGVLLAEGNEHAHQRKSLAPGFSIQAIRQLAPIFWEKSLLMSKMWQQEMATEQVQTKSYEILNWLNRVTLDVISGAGFGYDINSLENPDTRIRDAYKLVFNFDVFSHIMHGIQTFVPASRYLPVKMNRDINVAQRIILDKATEIIQRHESDEVANTGGKDVIALIARENKRLKEKGERGLSFETMRDQVMTFLGAGHDTTATGLAWTLHLLSTHPVSQSRLREEVREHMPFLFNKDTRFDPDLILHADADRLPFLDNVCRESLRYIPPIPMTVRQAVDEDMLGAYKIPSGTVVYIIANAINRMPMYWGDDADQFNPDRWDDLPKTFTTNAYMSFLQGPRGCIGKKFAETEMKILLCCLLSVFEFRRDEDTPDPEEWKMWRLVLKPKYGITVKVTIL